MKTPGRLDITLLVVMAHDMTHGYEKIAHEFTCWVATIRPRSHVQFYIISWVTKIDETFWTDSIERMHLAGNPA